MLGIVVGIVGIIVTVISIVVTVVSIRHDDKKDRINWHQKSNRSTSQSSSCFLIVTINQGEPFAMAAPFL